MEIHTHAKLQLTIDNRKLLKTQGYIIFRDFIGKEFCNEVVNEFDKKRNNSPLGLLDNKDVSDKIYHSKRSKNLSYKYMTTIDDFAIKINLMILTGLDFSNSINKKCLPVFRYLENGVINAHRGVQKESNLDKYQEYVSVLQLTQREEDFCGGAFYLNYKAKASKDGKKVWDNYKKDRFYPMLNKGDLIIFHNPSSVHGVEEVLGKDSMRMTCSWRTNEAI